MTFARMPGLLTALRNTFGEPAGWIAPEGVVSIQGRFRIDPYEVPLGGGYNEGLNTTQTWFYCARTDIASAYCPHLGDMLSIRGHLWEVVQIDADDIGELGYRLIRGSAYDPRGHGQSSVPNPVAD